MPGPFVLTLTEFVHLFRLIKVYLGVPVIVYPLLFTLELLSSILEGVWELMKVKDLGKLVDIQVGPSSDF